MAPPSAAPPPPPQGVVAPPPAPPVAGMPGDVPPDEEVAAPRINIESTFPKVSIIKYIGIMWLFAAFGLALTINHLLVKDENVLNLGLGIGLLGGGVAMGLFVFFNEDWRKWMSYFSAFAIIGGVAARPILTPLVTYDIAYVAPAALFAFTFFLYMEYLDAYQRFTDVGRMAVERNLQSFNLNQVINHFLTWGSILAGVFMVSALLILSYVTQAFSGAFGQELARSVEMQAVFGQAMVIAVIFTLVAVVFSFLFLFLDRRTEVQQVAYSREQIRDMVAQGARPGAPSGPAGPSGPGLPGAPPGPRGTKAGFVEQR
jgi:hypothetical protein